MSQPLDWSRDGPSWPHHEASRFVEAGGLRWHVQRLGAGPTMLLLHGTGASTHSWRGLIPRLADRFDLVAVDLPGHGFTDSPAASQLSLDGMAGLVASLVRTLGLRVDRVVGHSAGAAIGTRLVLDRAVEPAALVAINGAFMPLAGLAGFVFPPVAQLMAATPFAASVFARRRWDRPAVERLIGGTGSMLDAEGIALYQRLVGDPRHVSGALGMMARWDLHPLLRDLARLETPLSMIVGTNDRAVPPRDAAAIRDRLPTAARGNLDRIEGAGHLVHEERPAEVAERIVQAKVAGELG